MPYSVENRIAARKHVAEIRTKTVCEKCGKQPIEWHRDEHEIDGNLRIAHLVALGFPIHVIDKEISLCEALCRSCHMKTDGRMENLNQRARWLRRITISQEQYDNLFKK